jgi:N-methylhydantoinase A
MALPHVEVVSIGAGGGSIAWVDWATGLLHVGPQSAGSVPGPVAYGQGGEEPTVTDADIVLGRIDPERFFNRRKMLDRDRAEAAIKLKVAGPLGCDVHTAAKGILDIVDSQMGDLIRKLTIERGVDPRDFVLFSYGGAGPTHVGAYAREVGIRMAVVSPQASVFSALGIASSDVVRVYSHSHPLRSPFDPDQINGLFGRLEERAAHDLTARGVIGASTSISRSADMRFRHQVHQIKVPAPNGKIDADGLKRISDQFVTMYEQAFGSGTTVKEAGIEILTFHVMATTRHGTLTLAEDSLRDSEPSVAPSGSRPVYFIDRFIDAPIYECSLLLPGHKVVGPAILEGANTTMPLHPGQQLTVDAFNNFVIHFEG